MSLNILSNCLMGMLLFAATDLRAQIQFNKAAFYSCMAADSINNVNAQLKIVDASSVPEKLAYSGTLLMKKAGLAKNPADKLGLFKSGHKKLEAAIQKNNSNTEFHFLRLMIQENAPGFLGYKNDMQKDGEIVKESYKDLPEIVQQAVKDYSKKSKILKPADF